VAVHIADSYFKAVQGQARGGRRVGSLGTYKPSPLGGSSSGSGGDTGESQTGIDPAWSDDDFAQFVNLSKDPGEVGNRLVYLINKNKDQIPHECEVCARVRWRVSCVVSDCVCVRVQVELLVRAHHCFALACNLHGSEMVLHLVKERVTTYVEARAFKLLVRLLTGIKAYDQLRYMLDILMQYDQFEQVRPPHPAAHSPVLRPPHTLRASCVACRVSRVVSRSC
jgi:hypothetical protein